MKPNKLTQTFVNNAICPQNKQKIDYFDTEVRGLALKVMPTGTRTYYLRYTDQYSCKKERKLFSATTVSLNDAREQAKKFLAEIAFGKDPFTTKKERSQIMTLNEFVENIYIPYIKEINKKGGVDERYLLKNTCPLIGKLRLDQIDVNDIIKVIVEYKSTRLPSSANRFRNVLHRMFALAIRWKIAGVTHNPVADIDKYKENNKRDRFLSEDELRSLWKTLDSEEQQSIPNIIRMLLLTGRRKSEVLNAKWEDIDFTTMQWTIRENKSGKTQYHTISNAVRDLLQSIQRFEGCEYIFPNPDTLKPYNNIFHTWKSILKKASIKNFRVHDLRHTYASYCVNNNVSIYEVKQQLGHASVTTTERYAHLNKARLLAATNCVSNYVNQTINTIDIPTKAIECTAIKTIN